MKIHGASIKVFVKLSICFISELLWVLIFVRRLLRISFLRLGFVRRIPLSGSSAFTYFVLRSCWAFFFVHVFKCYVLLSTLKKKKKKSQIWCSYLHCLLLHFQAIAEIRVDISHYGFSSDRELRWSLTPHLSLTLRFWTRSTSALSFESDKG